MNFRSPGADRAQNLGALAGLRGVAALTVVLSHCSRDGMNLAPFLDFEGTGKLGVWLFFALSAFLLTRQFLLTDKPWDLSYAGKFLVRRVFRIFPLYLVFLSLDVVLERIPASFFVPAMLMIRAPDIFWTVPVEFQYYFLIPAISALLLLARRSVISIVVATAAIFLLNALAELRDPVLWEFLTIFLCGSITAYASVAGVASTRWLGVIALLCVAFVVNTAPAIMKLTTLDRVFDPDQLRNTPILFGPLFAPILLAAIQAPSWRRPLETPALQFLGQISYGVYLSHPIVLTQVARLQISSPLQLALALFATILVATGAHYLIEQPFRLIGYRATGDAARALKRT